MSLLVLGVNIVMEMFAMLPSGLQVAYALGQLIIRLICTYYIILHLSWDGRHRQWSRGAMEALKFKTLHRNSSFAIENQLSLAKCPP